MTKIKYLLALASLLAVTHSAQAGIKELGTVNGVRIVRVRTASVFAPSSTLILGYRPEVPGEVEVLSAFGGPGVVPACATAGGIIGGAALLRPARSETNVNGGNTSVNGGNTTSSGSPGWVPPGHR